MIYQQTTQIPNMLVDQYLPTLSGSEVKVLWVINRQTYGWIDKRTGLRKTRDWISHGQFITKTGLSRRVISKTLESLVAKRLINITCRNGNLLHSTEERRGKSALYYSINLCTKRQPLVHFTTLTSAESAHNKTKERLGSKEYWGNIEIRRV